MTTIQIRRGTAAQWTAANPVLASGEMGLETDTKEFKFGDGATTWNLLPYWLSDVGGHTHTASQISDSSAVGRSVLTAADAAAARSAIGAGTSNLAIGSTGTTAMAGNRTFSFAEITGLIGTSQLPPLAINEIYVVSTQAAMLALAAERGDMAIRSDIGETFVLSTDSPATLADWKMITSPGNVTSVAGRQGAVVLTKSDVGLSSVDNTADSAKPVSTAQQTALNLKANLASPAFTGTPTGITAAHVGLNLVNNTSDAAKPVSTATQSALDAKAPLASPTFTGTVSGVTKAHVGLSAVDNTSDLGKPVSTATQTALNLKANLASPAFTGTPTGITKVHVGLSNVENTSDAAKPISAAMATALNAKANTAHTHDASEITSIDGGTP